jgi:hypothetical protein
VLPVDLTTITDLAVAVGTAALAIGTFVLANKTKQSVTEAALARSLWTSLAIDTARARMDSAAPVVDLDVINVPWPPLARTQGTEGYNNPWPGGTVWTLPRQGNQLLAIKTELKIQNRSNRSVSISFDGSFDLSDGEPHILMPRAEQSVAHQAVFTLTEWSENYVAYMKEDPLPHVSHGLIKMNDQNENGVDDVWSLSLTGTPIEQVPGDAGGWRLMSQAKNPTRFTISPRHRFYFLSRTREDRLPDAYYGMESLEPEGTTKWVQSVVKKQP